MKIYSKQNVYEKALERIEFLFNEYDEVVVNYSGGKDSIVIFELAYKIAKKLDRLPLSVLFIDQEAEWTYTIEMVEHVMRNPDVKPYWFQMPLKIENATSFKEKYLYCWGEGEEWLREKADISIKENTYDFEWWLENGRSIFGEIIKKEFKGIKQCCLTGVRAEESPNRYIGLTSAPTYKWITWGTKNGFKDNHFSFHPLYDWSYGDVWKAIHENGWKYNKIYDLQYQYGVALNRMRVSNLHHETAVNALFYLQEVDGDLYNKLTKRLDGVDMAGKLGKDDYYVKKLPFMFATWQEYRDYLLDKLVDDEDWRRGLDKFIKKHDEMYIGNEQRLNASAKVVVSSIICNDYAMTKFANFNRQSHLDKRNIRLNGLDK